MLNSYLLVIHLCIMWWLLKEPFLFCFVLFYVFFWFCFCSFCLFCFCFCFFLTVKQVALKRTFFFSERTSSNNSAASILPLQVKRKKQKTINKCKEDHRSYRRNFCSCEKKAGKKFRLLRDGSLELCDTCAAL